jgi:hypothetical protein
MMSFCQFGAGRIGAIHAKDLAGRPARGCRSWWIPTALPPIGWQALWNKLGGEVRRNEYGAASKAPPVEGGTDGSNPLSSSGESAANSIPQELLNHGCDLNPHPGCRSRGALPWSLRARCATTSRC